MSKRIIQRIKGTIRRVHRQIHDPELRYDLEGAIEDLDILAHVQEKEIRDAKMIGVRNPAFDGDYIGYPEDDFENEEKSDDEDSK
jgi:hypothetical protein